MAYETRLSSQENEHAKAEAWGQGSKAPAHLQLRHCLAAHEAAECCCVLMSQLPTGPIDLPNILRWAPSKNILKRRAAMNTQCLDVLVFISQGCEQLGQRHLERSTHAGKVAQVLWVHSISDGSSDPALHVGRQLQEWREKRRALCGQR